jgi:hypothetical protein
MTSEEAFQFGFLARCVEEGLSPEETQARVEKLAWTLPMPTLGQLATGAIAVPALSYAGGRLLGHYAGGIGSADPEEYIEDLQTDELRDEYDRGIAKLRRLQAARAAAASATKKPTGRRVGF